MGMSMIIGEIIALEGVLSLHVDDGDITGGYNSGNISVIANTFFPLIHKMILR
jgi:hypothetical protein